MVKSRIDQEAGVVGSLESAEADDLVKSQIEAQATRTNADGDHEDDDKEQRDEKEGEGEDHDDNDDDDENEYWPVDEILQENSEGMVLVRWKGEDPKTGKPYPSDWIPRESCTVELLNTWDSLKHGAGIQAVEQPKVQRRISDFQLKASSIRSRLKNIGNTRPTSKEQAGDKLKVHLQLPAKRKTRGSGAKPGKKPKTPESNTRQSSRTSTREFLLRSDSTSTDRPAKRRLSTESYASKERTLAYVDIVVSKSASPEQRTYTTRQVAKRTGSREQPTSQLENTGSKPKRRRRYSDDSVDQPEPVVTEIPDSQPSNSTNSTNP
ncbi:hypothetical protein V1514DRAFT_90960 [Lipomyces japonicus]|uniref:uncharacterized protein n=1 Tax=Lipomyces japonicus TaxID=56871 RepID=UPI0034CFEA8B